MRELCCREAMHTSFRQAADDLSRVGQVSISAEMLRRIVEDEGRRLLHRQKAGDLRPAWTAADCRERADSPTCVITGADGVKVPMVTEQEKRKRRQRRVKRRRRTGSLRRRRLRKGSDQSYKEFKIVAFYDPSHERQYAIGTSGDHKTLGRLMRQHAGRIRLDHADCAYSVTDGAEWIRRQYQSQLPMLKANVLDYYHLREHVITAATKVFGEGTNEAIQWRKAITACALEDGPLELLGQLREQRKTLRSPTKRRAITELENYIAKRVSMLDYPTFRKQGYEIGSGPTEAFCKTLTARLKGSGRRWDRPNAEAIMALAATRASQLWKTYWTLETNAA
jgi:hypothetical protein